MLSFEKENLKKYDVILFDAGDTLITKEPSEPMR